MSECASKGCGCTTEPIIQPTAPAPLATGSAQAVYRIENMDCPTEEALIRSKLAGLAGVAGLEFNLMQRTLAVRHELPSLSPVEQALKAIGMQAVRMDQASAEQTTKLSIAKMDCPTEETLIRNKLGTVAGVADLDFNLMQRTLSVRHANQVLPDVLVALQALGFEAQVVDTAEVASPSAAPVTTPTNWWPLGISLVTASAAEAVYWLHNGNHWSVVVLALVAVFTGGLSTYKKGWIALKNRNLNMNALMSIAVTGAMLIGHWPEAAMVMVLFALAEVIEAKSLDRARNAIRGLLDLTPEQATVQQADGTWREVGAKQITIGARVRVKPGERIALDGEVLEGRSAVNQAPITGESLPVEKSPGDSVFAGTINESGSFEYRVTALANNSTLARIIHAVEAAQGSRAPTQRFVDQFARWYTPVVFGVAIAVALLPPLFMGAAWLDWIYRALVLLVVACPCALVISTPVSIVSGLAAAARHGILIKGGVYLEEGRKLRWLALDKTGTITHGKPAQTDFVTWGNALASDSRSIAASLAARSDHPVSKAVAQAAQTDGVALLDVAEFNALPGRGVQGQINGETYHLGNQRMLEELGQRTPELEQRIAALETMGKTVVMLVSAKGVHALFAVADTIKESSRSAIAELHALGINTMMLTGDNPHTAQAIAAQAGIDRAQGNLLPDDKLREVELLAIKGKVGMVGDGINDAPALARADIGFAMGAAGTDTAIETADVALMDDNLGKIPTFVRLSRATAQVLMQNIVLALGIKAVFLVLTFTGQATMWMAVFADMGASLLVVGNGLRLLRK
ncbi:TPA: heavy metal translocating P-type ATPase [Yersinia enterocolitica]|jgi:Cd2+/Zn2+-exporting ATPase|uniref:P-type Zn(2+) transporter n=4 Tax=Gammaproteobacteria TaxID=1236 RepID=Q07XH1_SHEFN|nr:MULTISPECIES: heavy metal translocating P-type ATPase [Gammaproteobacteria]EAM3022338.1 copper-translocating P-type ATPase [Salmonella enterica]EBH9217813.1 heavy metal translocating P-type ATPase [Salmonella enterica subsp. enterica serovar Ohio]ECH8482915.1 heavy metal translocating P-type ATPase [Salmonella enterica subsp. enterica serovar Senftenberg]ECU6764303.1 heavy metal translocating P-type ATPase [Salmonella enterica subsp. enterica serovar Havana]EHN4004350.1 heavy metal transloc|tara:strand:+ start:811 stop:3216 length:2406 start_codon:yes stop_codon:yes gene_type:complete